MGPEMKPGASTWELTFGCAQSPWRVGGEWVIMVTDGQTEGRCRLGREHRVRAQGVVGVMGMGRLGSTSLEGKGV